MICQNQLFQENDPNILPFLKQFVVSNNEYWWVQEAILTQLTTGWHDDPNTIAFLKQLILADQYRSSNVRYAALKQLA
ncbi:MAG: HEAT repeat domain-containing protein, partial [Okeania sp. SIO4D6]|nr:HEAT repeat domain-containing protein [Okeania sp. SIO4D6]